MKGFTAGLSASQRPLPHDAGGATALPQSQWRSLCRSSRPSSSSRSFEGDPQHQRSNEPSQSAVGRRLRVVFNDGEVMVGTTQGYDRSRPGFFVIPVDAGGDDERCFVVAAAAQEVSFI